MYSATTHDVCVTVTPYYLESQSVPENDQHSWAYHVRIENLGTETLQLISRYWRITDSAGRVKEVRGPGVVGEQPILIPGHYHEYTSGTMLETNSGIMEGAYQMVNLGTSHVFDVRVPAFSLDSPAQIVMPN